MSQSSSKESWWLYVCCTTRGRLLQKKNGVSRCIALWIEPFTDHNIAIPFPDDFLFHKTRNAIKENDTEPQDNKAWLCNSSFLRAVSFWETEYWLQLGAKWLPILQQEPESLTSPTSNLICSCLDNYKCKELANCNHEDNNSAKICKNCSWLYFLLRVHGGKKHRSSSSHSQENKPYILEFFHLLTKKWVWKSEENRKKAGRSPTKGNWRKTKN